ncbi:MAG: YggS family pyridoxal phosphate-dependent enzyme [Pirellulaceae bacterium]
MNSPLPSRLAENLQAVQERIGSAAAKSGRTVDQVTLVGVTKYVDVETTRALLKLGLTELGESRPQQLWSKAEALSDHPVRWHMIGNLQRNKAKRTIPLLSMLHSGDSLRLLQAASDSVSPGQALKALLEVNISGDANKHGFGPEDLLRDLPEIAKTPHIQVIGLMAMGSLAGGREGTRRDFASLREFRDRLRGECPPEISLDQLSMGMSDDYDIAIEEGATMVRVGSALFEGMDD